jgi:hypothetical protein
LACQWRCLSYCGQRFFLGFPVSSFPAGWEALRPNCSVAHWDNTLAQSGSRQKNTQSIVLQYVAQYFDLWTQSYFKNVMSPAFGVSAYWYRQEFAKSRGMVHWHGLCWRLCYNMSIFLKSIKQVWAIREINFFSASFINIFWK